jgi:3-phenylpropionate/trans-cinnamate dioxygenase ferredoxin reductase subunit
MPPRPVDVLLVGGGIASVRCARTLRRRGFTGSILLVGDEPRLPYNRPPLSKELLRGEVPDGLVAVEPDAWYARRGVELAIGTVVTKLDPASRTARLRAEDGRRTTVRFERCLLATGAAPVRPPVPGAERALVLRTLADARAIREQAIPGATAVVIGGGFIGIEVAAALADRGMAVVLLEREEVLWGGSLGPLVGAWAERVLAGAGVAVRLGERVSRIEPGAVIVQGGRPAGERIEADLVVAGVGVRPRVELAAAAGLEVDDGILIDDRQATSDPAIFAAGDVARPRGGGRVEHWHAARETGERAALAMLGEAPPARRAPWIYSDFAGAHLDVIGQGAADTEAHTIGDPASNRFAVAHAAGGQVVRIAVVNGVVAVDDARPFVEGRGQASELATLVPR